MGGAASRRRALPTRAGPLHGMRTLHPGHATLGVLCTSNSRRDSLCSTLLEHTCGPVRHSLSAAYFIGARGRYDGSSFRGIFHSRFTQTLEW